MNFPLHSSLRSFSGIDLSPLRQALSEKGMIPPSMLSNKKLSATWASLWFGLRPSPECACTYYYLAEEFIRGNHKDLSNPLRWDYVVLNLIGNKNYNPAFPEVYKWDERLKRITVDLISYIDDLRAIGFIYSIYSIYESKMLSESDV